MQGYVTWLGEMKFSPSTINQRLAAIRKLAVEAQRCGYVDSETAQAIVTVAGVSAKGRRLGRWLAWEEARTLVQAPNPHSIRGMRDRALLGVLVTCALRRGELSRMNCEHLVMRDGRWVFLDFKGKGNKTRSVAVPLWVKQEIDGWLDVAGIEKGPIFRRVLANGRVGKDALTERAVWRYPVSSVLPASRHLIRPGLALTSCQLIADAITAEASRVASGPLLSACRHHYPGSDRWNRFARALPSASAFPDCWAGRLLHQLFRGLLGVTARSACKTRRVA